MQKLVDAAKELLENRNADYLHPDDREMLQKALPTEASPELRERANSEYRTDDIEIDDTAYTSEASGGTWVSAWVWVPDQEEEN